MHPAAHGRGFATEALQAALAWADAHLSAPVGLHDRARERGQACGSRRSAATSYARTTYKGAPTLLLERGTSG